MDDILSTVKSFYASRPVPTVERVVRPPGGGGERVSPFTLVVLSDGSVGMSYNLLGSQEHVRDYDRLDWDGYRGRPALEVAAAFPGTDSLPLRILAFATTNALCAPVLEQGWRDRMTDADILDLLDPGPDDVVGTVGLFKPFAARLAKGVRELIVLERREDVLSTRYPFTVTGDPDELRRATKVVITSSTLLDGAIDGLLERTRDAQFRAVAGPGASFVPDPLFHRKVHAVGGKQVIHGPRLVERQQAGRKWADASRKYVIRAPWWRGHPGTGGRPAGSAPRA